jgi:hypothetical protein
MAATPTSRPTNANRGSFTDTYDLLIQIDRVTGSISTTHIT